MKQVDRVFFMIMVALIVMPFGLAVQNYDESRVGRYTLPPLLTGSQGGKNATVEEWEHYIRFTDKLYGWCD